MLEEDEGKEDCRCLTFAFRKTEVPFMERGKTIGRAEGFVAFVLFVCLVGRMG